MLFYKSRKTGIDEASALAITYLGHPIGGSLLHVSRLAGRSSQQLLSPLKTLDSITSIFSEPPYSTWECFSLFVCSLPEDPPFNLQNTSTSRHPSKPIQQAREVCMLKFHRK